MGCLVFDRGEVSEATVNPAWEYSRIEGCRPDAVGTRWCCSQPVPSHGCPLAPAMSGDHEPRLMPSGEYPMSTKAPRIGRSRRREVNLLNDWRAITSVDWASIRGLEAEGALESQIVWAIGDLANDGDRGDRPCPESLVHPTTKSMATLLRLASGPGTHRGRGILPRRHFSAKQRTKTAHRRDCLCNHRPTGNEGG